MMGNNLILMLSRFYSTLLAIVKTGEKEGWACWLVFKIEMKVGEIRQVNRNRILFGHRIFTSNFFKISPDESGYLCKDLFHLKKIRTFHFFFQLPSCCHTASQNSYLRPSIHALN